MMRCFFLLKNRRVAILPAQCIDFGIFTPASILTMTSPFNEMRVQKDSTNMLTYAVA